MIKKIYNTEYSIDTLGNVYRFGKILKPQINKGYLQVKLYPECKWYKIHRLVAETFIPNPENKPEVNHFDRDKSNNNVDNLYWATKSENMLHNYLTGREVYKGQRHHNYKLTEENITFIRENYIPRDKKYGGSALAKMFGVNQSTISCIINHQRRS